MAPTLVIVINVLRRVRHFLYLSMLCQSWTLNLLFSLILAYMLCQSWTLNLLFSLILAYMDITTPTKATKLITVIPSNIQAPTSYTTNSIKSPPKNRPK